MENPNQQTTAPQPAASSNPVSKKDLLLCTFLGVGKIPFAPGTFGTIAAFVFIFILTVLVKTIIGPSNSVYWSIFALVGVILALSANKAINRYITATNKDDPKEIVIDEVIGFMVAFAVAALFVYLFGNIAYLRAKGFAGVSSTGLYYLGMFLLFRFFDIVKLGPAAKADKINTGRGIIMDDVWAGIFAGVTLVVLSLGYYLFF